MTDIKLEDKERQPCETWTRVMGYHRPVSEFNCGKKSEFYARKCFCEYKAMRRVYPKQNEADPEDL